MYVRLKQPEDRTNTLSAKNAFAATSQAIDHTYGAGFETYVQSLGDLSLQAQTDALAGIAQAWRKPLPDKMQRIANQFSILIDQNWFNYNHVTSLIGICETLGSFSGSHYGHEAIQTMRNALSGRSLHGFESLLGAIDRGVQVSMTQPQRLRAA